MKANNHWIQQADNALQRAAQRAREVAERTKTPLHVIRDGKIVKLMPGTSDPRLQEGPPPAYGSRKP